MPRKVSYEIVADYSSVQHGYNQLGRSAKNFDRDFTHSLRGVISGSGAFKSLGRSLAIASGGFIAFAGVSRAIADSIHGAESLEKAQRGLEVAIRHTGGSVKTLLPQYEATAKAAQRFGVDQATATAALERATVLTGNAKSAQRAYQEALVISKATGKDFNAVLTATSKGQEGVTTSLQRYGILIAKGTPGQKQFNIVMERFGGQAKANTSVIDQFNATLTNTEEIVGTTLLPILNKYLGQLGNWLDKMTQSGKLQREVSHGAHDIVSAFHALAAIVKTVDKITGGFANTLKLLLGLKVAFYLRGLALQWDAVAVSAGNAARAEAAARGLSGGGGGGGGGSSFPLFVPPIPKSQSLVDRVAAYTGEGAAGAAAASRTAFATRTGLAKFLAPEAIFSAGSQGEVSPLETRIGPDGVPEMRIFGKWYRARAIAGSSEITTPGFRRPGSVGGPFGSPLLPGFDNRTAATRTSGPFGTAKPMSQYWKQFQLSFSEQLSQAQAGLTRSNKDDVAAAKQVVARIKRLIAQGRLHGKALIDALGLEASALSTIWSAEDAAAQKRAQAAAAAKAKIEAQIQNSIDPIGLEVKLSRAQALGQPLVPYLEKLRAAAKAALASGKLTLDQQKQAYDQITSLNQQIAQARATQGRDFTVPLKLQLAIAKDQALGKSEVADLKRERAAAYRALKSGKLSIQGRIDAYNEIASINQELANQATSGLGGFKQASTKALTAGLNLTAAQRKALRARLSQLGPGGTIPNQGVGAYGYQINPNTDRPIVIHHTTQLDGKVVARNTTRHQQRHHRRNPSQRRGPNAATTG